MLLYLISTLSWYMISLWGFAFWSSTTICSQHIKSEKSALIFLFPVNRDSEPCVSIGGCQKDTAGHGAWGLKSERSQFQFQFNTSYLVWELGKLLASLSHSISQQILWRWRTEMGHLLLLYNNNLKSQFSHFWVKNTPAQTEYNL